MQTVATTENGAYDLSATTPGTLPLRNTVNPYTGAAPSFFLPTENQWYKAAYFSPQKEDGPGYYTYATQQDVAPANDPAATSGPIANYLVGPTYSVTQSAVFSPTQNYLTDVGMFSGTVSFYGTLDQNGNVYQWNDLAGGRWQLRGLRGASGRAAR